MMISARTLLWLLGLGLVTITTAISAQAGETYICKDGSSVTVELADLERMKRVNACVAAYYPGASRKTADTAVQQDSVVSPVLKPRVAEKAAKRRPARVADFRRVRILNAGGSKPTYFIHSR